MENKSSGDTAGILPPLAKKQHDYKTATRSGTLLKLECTIDFLGNLPKFKESP